MAKASGNFLPEQESSNDWRSRRDSKSENSKEFRNSYRVLYRVPPTGPLLIKPAEVMLFFTGANNQPAHCDGPEDRPRSPAAACASAASGVAETR